MNENLSKKRILFIGIGFYDYEEAINDKLQECGAIVTYFSGQLLWERFLLLRVIAKIISLDIEKLRSQYFNSIVGKIAENSFDYVLIIKGDQVTEDFISTLREKLSLAHFIMYQWDSLVRVPTALKLFPYFDKIFSFDRIDCLNYPMLHFRPLFFRDKGRGASLPNKFDITFIGFLHSDRLSSVLKISAFCRENKLTSFFYLTTGLKQYFEKLINGDAGFLHLRKMSHQKVTAISAASRVILDFSHPLQFGLTMRTIEAIGLGKKMITNNGDIVNYDFYDKSNILVIDEDCEGVNKEFVGLPYSKTPDCILNGYTLESWVCDVFRA